MHKYKTMLLAAGVVAAASFSSAQARDLTVVGFGGAVQDAFRDAYFTPYAKEKGITVLEDTTNGGLAKQKAMVDAGNVTWDVMQMEDDEVTMACEQGLLENIDWSKQAHADEIDPSQFKECAVGALSWANILTYDTAKLTDGPKNWVDFWNVEKWPGKRGLRKTAKLTMEVALMADGVPPSEVYSVIATKEGQDRAFAKLDELKPHIQWWESGAQPQEWLSSGDVVMTSAYNGRVDTAQKEGKNFAIIWDGQINSTEFWAIMKGTPNLDQSIAFVEFLMSKDPQVTFANKIAYGVSNVKAMEALPTERLAKLPSAPDNLKNAVRFESEFWIDHGEELAERFASWVAQ
ncbi:MAG: ABC transporter substrate-binding protein [Shinella sp.]|uniref:ABC transporter substrate-binding protein n=1 Tax=Shinella sp. TaxID=1870904 RepID=UPI0040370C8E